VILCDVGNSRMHFCIDDEVLHFEFDEGLKRFKDREVYFISVNQEVTNRIRERALKWKEIKSENHLKTSYKGLGIDRVCACLGVESGVVVDAGSAITVDVMEDGVHLGGWIWPGLRTWLTSYTKISKKLSVSLETDIDVSKLPQSTTEAVSFGILAPIVTLIKTFSQNRKIILTGGDAKVLSSLFPTAEVDERVVFKGMKKMIKTRYKEEDENSSTKGRAAKKNLANSK